MSGCLAVYERRAPFVPSEENLVPNEENREAAGEEISAAELRYWLEFACWATLAVAPFLYWINGPSVSEDQFITRTALVVLAAFMAVGLRAYSLRWRRHL
jgi:hypothetical protein